MCGAIGLTTTILKNNTFIINAIAALYLFGVLTF
jgi:hypothetical protein